MTDSNDTSAIDNKNKEANSTQPGLASNIFKFLQSVILLIVIFVVYFSFGGLILYGCKLGQSNILPTDKKCYPYDDVKPDIQPVKINVFTTMFEEPQQSMKMTFPYDVYNSSNKIIDMFRKYKQEPKSNFMANYFISIMEDMIKFNYSSLNFILNLLNGWPEMLVILFGPIILPFFTSLIFLFDHIYLIYLWFANMGWFFKQNTNSDLNHGPVWENVTIIEPIDYWCSVALVILFLFLFWFLLASLPVLPSLTMSWCLFSCATYTAQMNGKHISALTIIRDIFKYHKVLFMSIFSFFIIVNAFGILGTIPGIFSIITLILIYFGIISIDAFKVINPENLSPVSSYDQAKKVCTDKANKQKHHGLLYHLIFGQDGGSITKELKTIGKKLNSK